MTIVIIHSCRTLDSVSRKTSSKRIPLAQEVQKRKKALLILSFFDYHAHSYPTKKKTLSYMITPLLRGNKMACIPFSKSILGLPAHLFLVKDKRPSLIVWKNERRPVALLMLARRDPIVFFLAASHDYLLLEEPNQHNFGWVKSALVASFALSLSRAHMARWRRLKNQGANFPHSTQFQSPYKEKKAGIQSFLFLLHNFFFLLLYHWPFPPDSSWRFH